jgi:hypothetical protein
MSDSRLRFPDIPTLLAEIERVRQLVDREQNSLSPGEILSALYRGKKKFL